MILPECFGAARETSNQPTGIDSWRQIRNVGELRRGRNSLLGMRLPAAAALSTVPTRRLALECIACRSPFAGVLMPEMVPMLSQRVRLAERHFDQPHTRPLPAIVQVLLQGMADAHQPTDIRDNAAAPGYPDSGRPRPSVSTPITGSSANRLTA